MTTNEAIEYIIASEGRPKEDDWELLEAAEQLATEVTSLRRVLKDILKLINGRILSN